MLAQRISNATNATTGGWRNPQHLLQRLPYRKKRTTLNHQSGLLHRLSSQVHRQCRWPPIIRGQPKEHIPLQALIVSGPAHRQGPNKLLLLSINLMATDPLTPLATASI